VTSKIDFSISRYTKIEIIFFVVFFFVFRFLTDFEYNYWERNHFGISIADVKYNLAFGISSVLPSLLFYRVLCYCLKKEAFWPFLGFLLLYLAGYHFYQKWNYYLFAQFDLFSNEQRQNFLKWFRSKSLGYTLSYMFREFLALGALAYFVHSSKQRQQMEVLKEQQLISELTYLKAQLQPHFFFNTLNNIYGLALKQSTLTAPLVAKLSEMMRYILYKADAPLVTLEEEINFIENYVAVEKVRYRDAIQISLDLQGIGDMGEISPLLLLPFVENAFKHGIEEEQQRGFVKIVICRSAADLTMEIENSIASKTVAIGGGIGLINVRKRLALLYEGRHQLDIENDGKVFRVSLTLAIK
jgi:sensor histidine kinase YesM